MAREVVVLCLCCASHQSPISISTPEHAVSHDDLPVIDFTSAADVDALIARTAETTRRLRYARNTFSLINRLPAELLSAILLLLLPSSSPSCLNSTAEATFFSPFIREWYRVTHVCRRWRAVALGCRLLWTQLDLFAGPAWVGRMLDRAGNAPLTVKASVSRPSEGTMQALAMAVEHLGHTQTLHLSIDRATLKELLPVNILANTEMLRLRSLVISNIAFVEDVLDIPAQFFAKGVPHLEHLEFQQCSILSWDMPLFHSCPKLKTLRIRSCQSSAPTMVQLMRILRSMPLLEELHLIGVLPAGLPISTSTLAANSAPSVVSLPRLRTLALFGHALELAGFLTHFQLPSSSQMTTSISCRTPLGSEMSELSLFCGLLSPFFLGNSAREGLDVSVSSTRVRFHTSTGTSRKGIHERLPAWADFGEEGSLLFTVGTELASARGVMGMLARFLPLQNVSTLSVEDDRVLLDLETFGKLLKATPNVTTLQVFQEAGIQVPDALLISASLARSATDLPSPTGPPFVLPKLDHLILSGVDLSWTLNHVNLLSRLQEAQFQRCEALQAVSELSVVRCYDIREEEVRVLCQLFVDVHWDGFQMCWSDDEEDGVGEEGQEEEEAYREMWEMWDGGNVGWHS